MDMALDDERLQAVFGHGLKRIRKRRGMKQQALATATGYKDHTNIVKMEGGKTLPSLGKALELARVLQVPVEAFVYEGYHDEGFSQTYRVALASTVETRRQIIHMLRTMADDLERICAVGCDSLSSQRAAIMAQLDAFYPALHSLCALRAL